MINMTVAFGPAEGGAWHLLFKDKTSADEVFKTLTSEGFGMVTVTDDFGTTACVNIDTVHGVVMQDYSQTGEADIQRGLHQARTQAKANSRGSADPELKGLAALNGRGPQMPMRA
jgi:hypothetical protein